jgi:hypothetical protein
LLTPSSLHDENPGTLTFPNESPAHFKVLITFLHTGAIRHPNFRATAAPKHAFLFLTELFAFAGRFDMYALRNAILDAFFIRMTINPDNLPYESIRDVYAHTSENSSLRDLIIDTVIHIGTSEDVEKWSKELPRQFLVDCLKVAGEDEVVLYRAERGVWVEQKGKNMCAHYHVHEDKDEDEEDKDEEEEEEISEQTRQELAFIDELRKAQIRY